MKTYRIATIPGDGIGQEVVPAGRRVMEALAASSSSFRFEFDDFDWGGDHYRRHGTMMPADTGQHPPLHIHNSITRAFRFMQLNTGIAVEHVDAIWPDSDNGAYYDGEVNIGPNEQWNEGTIIHEYGHHILDKYAENVSPDYCNDFCDGEAACTAGDDCDNEGHCTWCPETDHDAWNEGFPDWFAGAVIRTFLSDYGLQALSINDGRYNVESIGPCGQDGMTSSALITQGYITALMQDMEDGLDDDHSGGTYVCDAAPPTLMGTSP